MRKQRFLSYFLSTMITSSALAAPPSSMMDHVEFDEKSPAFMRAETVYYDRNSSLVTADGKVEILHGNRILIADQVTYDQRNDTVKALGNISLLEPDGSVLFAHEVLLRDGFKAGAVEHFRAKLSDGSRIAAQRGRRENGTRTTMERAVYSPCPICKEDPDRAPLWQLKAREATLDEEKERVSYKHSFFEVYGVPVLYSPYFSHPSPDAKRKSGLLTPSYESDTYFGHQVTAPLYWNIAPQMDATITPTVNTRKGPVLAAEFRHLLPFGQYELSASGTYTEKVDDNTGTSLSGNETRGHYEGNGLFNLNEFSTFGFNVKHASDDTYLRRYNFGNEDILESRVFQENIYDRQYFGVEAIHFQGLNILDDPDTTPFILPAATGHVEVNTLPLGLTASFDGDVLVLGRDKGAESRRASLEGALSRRFIIPGGQVITARASLRGDGYHVNNVPDPVDPSISRDGTTGRIIPTGELQWSLPFIRNSAQRSFTIEPRAQFIVSPHGGNPEDIPNEDSQDIEFGDDNLFDVHHYVGLDRVEGGPRANYGLALGMNDAKFGTVDMLFGQNLRVKRDNLFPGRSGIGNYASDYVGRISYQAPHIVNLDYRFRVDHDNLTFNRNIATASLNFDMLRVSSDYVWLDEDYDNDTGNPREEIYGRAEVDVTKRWTFEGNIRRDLGLNSWVATGAGLLYSGDCVSLGINYLRTYTRDRDIRPDNSVTIQFGLRNLGGV